MSERYKVIDRSQSAHCCFEYTVVDTNRPVMIGDEQYKDNCEPMCECFEKDEADTICSALNAYNRS